MADRKFVVTYEEADGKEVIINPHNRLYTATVGDAQGVLNEESAKHLGRKYIMYELEFKTSMTRS